MTLASLLTPDRVIPSMQATEHWPAIQELVDHLVSAGAIPEAGQDSILESFRDREDQCSTGVGGGIAIPHAFSEHVGEVTAIFGRSPEGIEFGALDDEPVHYVVLFVVPAEQYTLHLRALAAIAKVLNNEEVRGQLVTAEGEASILDVLSVKAGRV